MNQRFHIDGHTLKLSSFDAGIRQQTVDQGSHAQRALAQASDVVPLGGSELISHALV